RRDRCRRPHAKCEFPHVRRQIQPLAPSRRSVGPKQYWYWCNEIFSPAFVRSFLAKREWTMRKFVFGVAGSVAVASIFSASFAFGQLQGPPPGWTFTFGQSQPIDGSTPVTNDNGLLRAPVRSPIGSTLGRFLRVEMQDSGGLVGIVTLNVPSRTV